MPNCQNRVTAYMQNADEGADPFDALVDMCEAFCEESDERDRCRNEALSAIDGMVMLKDEQGLCDLWNEIKTALDIVRTGGITL